MHKKQWQPEALVPISSKYLMELTIGKECKVGEFYEARKLTRDDHKYIFVERNHFDEKERIDDVILLDKVT